MFYFWLELKIVYTNTFKCFFIGATIRYKSKSKKALKSSFLKLKCIRRRTGQSMATAVESILVNLNLKIEILKF